MKKMPRAIVLTSLLALLAHNVSAQQIFQGGPPPPGQGGPPRDTRPSAQIGMAVIRGQVVAADTGRPLRRARIQMTAPELGPGDNRTTSTGVDGKFEMRDLPAGRYTVTVNRSGYLRLSYGQRRPFEQGKPIQISDRQVVENVNFALPRMSLITGRVYDEAGEAISDVQMFAMRTVYFEGKRRLVPVAGGPVARTDDAGQYRLLGLPPGSYYVMADLRETWTVNEGGTQAVMGYAQTYFPSTTSVTEARRVTVGVGQEASNTDVSLIPGRAAAVSGIALDSQGRPLAGRQVSLGQEYRGPGFMMMMMNRGAPIGPDGSFTIKDLAPGEYKLRVQTSTEVNGVTVQESASVPLVASGVNLDGVAITTSSGWSVAGHVIGEDGTAPSVARERVRIIARSVSGDASFSPPPGAGADSGRMKADWTFEATGITSASRIRATVPDGWIVKGIQQDGRDVTDVVFDLKSGDTVSGLQVVLSNRVNSITGQLTDSKGAPISDGTVIVFASEPDKWHEDSRYVRSARPDQSGNYKITGMPPGEYLAVAIDYVEEGTWNDPEYLESIRRYGQRITLGETDAQAISLKLVTPQP